MMTCHVYPWKGGLVLWNMGDAVTTHMERQIFAYMQLHMVMMSHMKTGFAQPSGIITKTREGMLTSRYWLRIIHRWEQSPARQGVFWGLLCFTHVGCQTCHRCFSNEQVPKTKASVGYVRFPIVQSSYVWASVLVSNFQADFIGFKTWILKNSSTENSAFWCLSLCWLTA